MKPITLATLSAAGAILLAALGFAIGTIAGLTYTSRDKVCAVVQQGEVTVPVCEYGYEPPEGWEIR